MVGEFNTYNKMNHLLKCCSLREPNFTVLYQIEFYEHVFEFMSYYMLIQMTLVFSLHSKYLYFSTCGVVFIGWGL